MFRVFGGERIRGLMSAFQIEDLPMESRMLVRPGLFLAAAHQPAAATACACLWIKRCYCWHVQL